MSPLMLLRLGALAAIVAAVFFIRSHWIGVGEAKGYAKGHAEYVGFKDAVQAEVTKKLAENARIEKAQRESFNAIEAKLRQENDHAKQYAENIAAELRAGKLKLRQHWQAQTCPSSVSSAPDSTSGSDANAELRERDFGNLVSIGKRADDQVKACQAILNSERGIR